MGSQGPLYAGTVADDATIGTLAWNSPTNAQGTANGTYATRVQVGASWKQNSVKLVKAGSVSGADKSTGAVLPIALTWVSFGNSTDLWSNTLAPADVNLSTFGFAFSASNGKATPAFTHYLKATNFGFTIGLKAVITGVVAEIDMVTQSFIAGTLVRTSEGLVPIELIVPGMLVRSFAEGGTLGWSRVLRATHKPARKLVRFNECLTCTPLHDLFTLHGFKAAGKLKVGDCLREGDALTPVPIYKIEKFESVAQEVYCLSVDNHNTFFANGFAVHNLVTSTPPGAYVDAMRMTVYFTQIPKGLCNHQNPGCML